MNRNPGFAVAVATTASPILVTLLYQHSPAHSPTHAFTPSLDTGQPVVTDLDLQDIMNRTIGFEKVFVLSLPARTDRLDIFTMQASAIDMDFTVVTGVDGKLVQEKVLPWGMTRQHMGNGGIGCWRAHLNAYQQMVQHNIQPALIFEDDADWDLVFKYQMLDVARGTRFLLNSTGSDTNSPYGDK